MRTQETRTVEVLSCDFCKKEVAHLSHCAICKKEMCLADGGKEHICYSVEIYRYKDMERVCGAYVCKECANKPVAGATVREFLDSLSRK